MAGKALRWRPSVVVSGGSCRYVPVKWAYCSDLYTCRAFLLCLFSGGMAAVSNAYDGRHTYCAAAVSNAYDGRHTYCAATVNSAADGRQTSTNKL